MDLDDDKISSSDNPLSPANRIKELNAIDSDVSKVLATLSRAISMLANKDHGYTNPSLQDVQDAFDSESQKYFASLASIDVRLRRQVHALEEAGLIPPGSKVDRGMATAMSEEQGIRRSGGGPLDSSWLNARVKDSIGQSLKREALDNAKKMLKKHGIETKESKEDQTMLDADHT